MASLTQEQQEAWLSAYEKAQNLGLTDEQASTAASTWATRTDFGKNPSATVSLGSANRSDEPSSNIEQLFAAAVEAVDPTFEGVVWSGQEPPVGLANLTSGQRREHRAYMAQGFDSETASRIVNREGARYRHPLGVAVDTQVKDIAGKKIADRDITDQVAFNFVQATGGNVGRGGFVRYDRNGRPINYMSSGTNHYDTANLRPGMKQFWGSLDKGFLLAMQQANALHDMDRKDSSRVPMPVPRGSWGFVDEHPSDAMGIATEAPKSAIPPMPAPPPDGFFESAHPVDAMGFATEAPKSAIQPEPARPDGLFESAHPSSAMGQAPQSAIQPTRNDYPVASSAPTPPQSRFTKGFTRSVNANPQSPSLTPDGIRSSIQPSMDTRMADSLGRSISRPARPAPRSALSDTRLADSLGSSVGPAPISALSIPTPTPAPRRGALAPEPQSALLNVPTPTQRPTRSAAPKSALLDVPVPTARPAQTAAPQSAIQSPVEVGRAASRQSVQSPIAQAPPASAINHPMAGYDPITDKPAPRSTVGQKYGVPAGRATGALAGAALAGPLGAAVGNALGKSIAQNQTRKGYFPPAPFAPASVFPTAPKAPPKSNFDGGPGSNGLSSYGNQAFADSGQFADAWSSGGLGLY